MTYEKLTVVIDGREALPVRAIPYVTDWRLSPSDVVRGLARKSVPAPFHMELLELFAYCKTSTGLRQMKPIEWEGVLVQLEGYQNKLAKEHPDAAIGYASWRETAPAKLPPGVFVWLDEFERAHQADLKRHIREDPRDTDEYDKHTDAVCREYGAIVDDEPLSEPVTLTPVLSVDLYPVIMEGFAGLVVAGEELLESGEAAKDDGATTTAKASREAHDITKERGCRRWLLEHWNLIEQLNGPRADGRQALRVLKRELSEEERLPTLKTVQNKLAELRKEKLIP